MAPGRDATVRCEGGGFGDRRQRAFLNHRGPQDQLVKRSRGISAQVIRAVQTRLPRSSVMTTS
jgi:hypothetical protein